MNDPALWAASLVFVAVVFALAALFSYLDYHQGRRKLVAKIQGEVSAAPGEDVDRGRKGSDGIKAFILNVLTAVGARVKPRKGPDLSPLRTTFLRAGYRGRSVSLIYYGTKALLAAMFPSLLVLVKVLLAKPVAPMVLMTAAVTAAVVGFYLPDLWLRLKMKWRREKIFEGFPDALDLMVVCVEAGMGLDAVVQRVGQEMVLRNDVVADEFNHLSLELRAGKSRAEALRHLALRANLEDVGSLVTLLIQTDRFGTSVAQSLRVHSSAMRMKRQQRAEELAAKLPVKLVFPLICFIFPALFVVLAGPAAIKIIRVFAPHVGGG